MGLTADNSILELPGGQVARVAVSATGAEGAPRAAAARTPCFHCGEPCPDLTIRCDDKTFCCAGCRLVHDLLAENGLGEFYQLSRHPGVRISRAPEPGRWAYLDEPATRERLLDFTDGKTNRVTFHIPAIHCVACVWLLENLFRLHPGVGGSQVNFPRREVSIQFASEKLSLGGVAALLASIGYEPKLTMGELEQRSVDPARKRRWLQLGIAGFAFGNIMLLTIPLYFGLDEFNAPAFRALFGWLSLALAAPVLAYSASDYWRSAFLSIRQRVLTLDFPIALGLAALYAQSAWEIASGRGAGYLDSLVGLVFFLLCGRAFQRRTQERIVFDRDYKSFFPLAVKRKWAADRIETISISSVQISDRLLVRNGELIPADARLVSGTGCIDYSFVTGEAEPVARRSGDYLYAGGKQIGEGIEIETVKPVSQSYLTSLWEHDAFHKDRFDALNTLTNLYSRRFTAVVIAVAVVAALFWIGNGQPARGLKAFISVLIVACPCALALASPFAFGTAQRLLARVQIFLKNTVVLERLARVDAVVFDKTGTLTTAETGGVRFHGDSPLSASEAESVFSLARHSTHPHSVRIAELLAASAEEMRTPRTASLPGSEFGTPSRQVVISVPPSLPAPVPCAGRDAVFGVPLINFLEKPGHGLEALIAGRRLQLGSHAWLAAQGCNMPTTPLAGSHVCLAIDGSYRGAFSLENPLRPDAACSLERLGRDCDLSLLSGDNDQQAPYFRRLFGPRARLLFHQSPLDKLKIIQGLQSSGRTVMMVGDGLNDAGALKQSDVGVAVVEHSGAFSPASDVIVEGRQVPALHRLIGLARRSTKIVHTCFGISAAYNLIGISIAGAGLLSPLICAVLMPLSSISVVLFACSATTWAARREKLLCP